MTSGVSCQVEPPDRSQHTSNLVLLWSQNRENAAYGQRAVTPRDASADTPPPPPSSPPVHVNDPTATLGCANLVHGVLQYYGLENYSRGGEGTCTVATTGVEGANGLLLAALRSRIPGCISKTGDKRSQKSRKGEKGKEPRGGGREATPVDKIIYRRDVCVQTLCVRLRKHAESRGTADAAPQDAQHWPTYGHLNEVLLALLLDKHAVDSRGTFCFLLGVGVKQLDLVKALQSATLTPAQTLVLCALRHIAPIIGNVHFADFSTPYRLYVLQNYCLALTPASALIVPQNKKSKKDVRGKETCGGGCDATPVTRRAVLAIVDQNMSCDVPVDSDMGLALAPDNLSSRSMDDLLRLLRLSVFDVSKRGVNIAYCLQFLRPDFLKSLSQLHAKQDYGGGLTIDLGEFLGGGAGGASSSGAGMSSIDERELADCVMAVDEACSDVDARQQFLVSAPAQPSPLRASITRLKTCVSRTLLDLAHNLLSKALVSCSQGSTSAAGDGSHLGNLTLIPRSLATPLPTAPFEFTVRNIDLSEPLARVGGMQNGALIQSWQFCGSYVQLVVLRAPSRG